MAIEITMPQLGESVTEGTVGSWLVKEGEKVEEYQPLLEIITDKVDTEFPSPASGVVLRILVTEGETVAVGTLLAYIGEQGEEVPEAAPAEPAPAEPVAAEPEPAAAPRPEPATAAPSPPGRRFSPVVARIAAEHGVNLVDVSGTGRGGRVTKKDILAYVELMEEPWRPREVEAGLFFREPGKPAEEGEERRAPERPATSAEPGEVLRLTPMRKAIAEHMVRSKQTSAHVTTVFQVDMTRVQSHREALKNRFQQQEGVPLTYTTYFVEASVAALKEVPIVNATLTEDGILARKEINIGLAVALEEGLIVPVIKNADDKSSRRLAREIYDLANRARNKQLVPDDVAGGTFTITNHGVAGSLFATPIINQPQAAILGVGAIEKRPLVIDEAIAIRPAAYLSLTFDHRIFDGSVADRFLAEIVRYLESYPSPR
ncbi:MAG: dihydrolipoamide acetyltransferase family protein [Anaerolineae bacterium]